MALDTSYEVRLRREGEGDRKSAKIKNGMTAKKKNIPGTWYYGTTIRIYFIFNTK